MGGILPEAVAALANMVESALMVGGAGDRSTAKITGLHLERLAVVYLRQSSPRQVRENFRSTERQYAIAEEAARLGLGVRADRGRRRGFRDLRPVLGRAGAEGIRATGRAGLPGRGRRGLRAGGLEAGAHRTPRRMRLLEFCALTDTLVVDTDGVYDLQDFNDRLLLGLSVPDFRPSLTSSTSA